MKAALILALTLGTIGNEFDLDDMAATVETTDADTDDDIIHEELSRRSDFDRQHTKAMARLFLRPKARDEDQAVRRQRIMAAAAVEVMRRMAFDEKHPGIYKSAEEEHRAYLIFHPGSILKRLIDKNAFDWGTVVGQDAPPETGPGTDRSV